MGVTVWDDVCVWATLLVRMCICISTSVHMCLTPHVCCITVAQIHQYLYACAPGSPCLLHCPCKVTWKTWVPLFGTVCMSQPLLFWSHILVTCISTCVHVHLTSHVCSSTFAQMHQYLYICAPDYLCLFHCLCPVTWKTWLSLCGTVCVSQSCLFWSHTLDRMCTSISACMCR